MKKIVDDRRTIYRCCKMYYEMEMGQQEIADSLAISRATVSKMLKLGKEMGIVSIQVINPGDFLPNDLGEKMMKLFHLKDVVIVEDSPLETRDEFVHKLAVRTVHLIRDYIHEDDVIGVSMGKTLHDICHCQTEEIEPVKCTFVPVVGGVLSGLRDAENNNSNRIAADMAEVFGGEYAEFFSPAMFSNREVMEGFLQENAIKNIFRYYRRMSMVVMGIGIPNRGASIMVKAGYIKTEELENLVDKGLVGDLSLQFFDEDGNTEKFSDYNCRVAGMPLSQIAQINTRIAIAARGISQAKALYAAVKRGFVNVLVLDQITAMQLIQWKELEDRGEK